MQGRMAKRDVLNRMMNYFECNVLLKLSADGGALWGRNTTVDSHKRQSIVDLTRSLPLCFSTRHNAHVIRCDKI